MLLVALQVYLLNQQNVLEQLQALVQVVTQVQFKLEQQETFLH
jgi:hypothetical protein